MAAALCVALAAVGCSRDGDSRLPPGLGPDSAPATTIERQWTRPEIMTPTNGLRIAPGEPIQAAVDGAGEESVFILESGMHRLQQVEPRHGDTFVGEDGAVVSGARLLENFEADGGRWVHDDISVAGEERGQCRDAFPACRLPEDLFIDDELLTRVLSLDQVDENTWYLDNEQGHLWLGRDPEGRRVELSVLPYAFGGGANEVTIVGLVIEKYAAPAQRGAIMAQQDWTVRDAELRYNHGTGVSSASGLLLEHSYLHHNGQFGISGGGVGVQVHDNEIAHNGTVGFSPGWAAGGTKFVQVHDLELMGNYVHSNFGPGLWVDGGEDATTYRANRVVGNEHAGIKHEISGSATITENYVAGNGFGHSVDLRGPGILVRESGPVQVTENVVVGNKDAIVLLQDDDRSSDNDKSLTGVEVADNDIQLDGGRVGFIGDLTEAAVGDRVSFDGNRYYGDEQDLRFVALDESLDVVDWREAAGEENAVVMPPESFPST